MDEKEKAYLRAILGNAQHFLDMQEIDEVYLILEEAITLLQ